MSVEFNMFSQSEKSLSKKGLSSTTFSDFSISGAVLNRLSKLSVYTFLLLSRLKFSFLSKSKSKSKLGAEAVSKSKTGVFDTSTVSSTVTVSSFGLNPVMS